MSAFRMLAADNQCWTVPHCPAKSRETTPRSHASHNALNMGWMDLLPRETAFGYALYVLKALN